jgi:hypothetical protein
VSGGGDGIGVSVAKTEPCEFLGLNRSVSNVLDAFSAEAAERGRWEHSGVAGSHGEVT